MTKKLGLTDCLTCLDRVMRGGPLGFLLRVGRGGGLGEVPSVSEDDTSLH